MQFTLLRVCCAQHSIGSMGDSFYSSKDPSNSIKVLTEKLQRKTHNTQTTTYTHNYEIVHAKWIHI